MTNGYYLLARFTSSDKLLPAVRLLADTGGVTRWDAVEGHLHLIVRTDENVQASVVRFTALDEYAQIKPARLVVGDPGEPRTFNGSLRAYLLIETEPRYKDSIRSRVTDMSGVLSCVATEGPCDIIAIVTGETLSAIDHMIEDEIRPMDGVLRVKRNRVINLEQI